MLWSARPCRDSLVANGLDSLGGTLIVVLLHVAVHGAKLHLPPEVDVHGALLHRGVDELVGWVSQLDEETDRIQLSKDYFILKVFGGNAWKYKCCRVVPFVYNEPVLTLGSLMPVMRSSGRSNTRKAARLAV